METTNSYFTKTEASVKTFLAQIKGRNTRSNRTDVYRSIKANKGCTKDDLIGRLSMPHQTVTSRVSALMDLGVVEVIATRSVISGNISTFHSMFSIQTDPIKIHKNQQERGKMKFNRLLNQLKNYKDIIPSQTYEVLQSLKL